MRRGDVCVVDFDPSRGGEAAKRRPAVIVSNNHANRTAEQLGRGVVTVVPITSNVQRVYPFQVRLPAGAGGLRVQSKAQAEQVRAVAVGRVGERLGRLDEALMRAVDGALRLHLEL
ncbi:MAG: type II toxin-antitoxin system PemK/MazF family toxin [Solirubrobacteraceae bacterium]